MQLTVEKIIQETDDAVSVIFKKPGFFNPLKYKPGQFLTLKLPIKNKIENRAYSLSSSPWLHKFLRITVKKVNDGLVSNYICNELKEGQKIEIEKPSGHFFVSPKKSVEKTYVLFAGGSGITPIYSIALSILEKEKKSKILLVYANKSDHSIIFKKEIEELQTNYPENFSVHHFISNPTNELKLNYHKERLNEALLDIIIKNDDISYKEGLFMICGPQGFMDAAVAILKKKEVAPEHIKLEAFTVDLSQLEEQSSNAVTSNITVKGVGGTDVLPVAKGKTILQAAMDNDVEIPYSCRSGMCSSCMAKCTSGKVTMMEGHLLSDQQVADGYILTCVAFPETETVEIILPQ